MFRRVILKSEVLIFNYRKCGDHGYKSAGLLYLLKEGSPRFHLEALSLFSPKFLCIPFVSVPTSTAVPGWLPAALSAS